MRKGILLAALLLAGCDSEPNACTKESADAAGAYFSACMQGDGQNREGGVTCKSGAMALCKVVRREPR